MLASVYGNGFEVVFEGRKEEKKDEHEVAESSSKLTPTGQADKPVISVTQVTSRESWRPHCEAA